MLSHFRVAILPALFLCLAASGAVTMDIPGIRGISIVTPANADDFALVLINTDNGKEEGDFEATLTPPSGKPVVRLGKRIALRPGENIRLGVSLAGRELGVWTVTWTFNPDTTGTGTEGKPGQTTRSLRFALMDPAGPNDTRPEFRFGIVAHIENRRNTRADRQREIAAAALIGVKTIRSNPSWWATQPEPDIWRWELMDEFVDDFAADGMECQVLLGYNVPWATLERDKGKEGVDLLFSAPQPEAWRGYVAAMVSRYKSRIVLWEPWNEPDLGFWRGTTEEYIELARITIEEVRRNDPAAKVMSGGFATLTPHAGRKRNPDLQERVMRELGPHFDYHAVHEHGSFSAFAHLVDGAYATFRASLPEPVPPFFFNETALTAIGGPDAEKNQSEALVKKATFARSRGAAGYLWYDLRNDGVSPSDPEHNYGLITHDFQPKPVYVAFNTYARHVVPRPFLRQLDAGKNRWLFLHGNHISTTHDAAGDTAPALLLVFWNDDPTLQNEQLLLRLPGSTRASLVDLNGNVTALELTGESVAINTNSEPRYLLAEGARDIEIEGRLAGPPRPHFGAPGEEVEVACEFLNPFDRPLQVNVRWTSPLAMKIVQPAAASLHLAPRSQALSTLTVRLPEGSAYRFGQNGRLRLDYDYEGTPFTGSLQIPVQYGTISILKNTPPNRTPDIVLDRKEQLLSFIDADPNLAKHRWSGPDDLSARIWLGVDEESLILRIEVSDNRHHQTQTVPAEIWREDSVQCMLEIPGQRGFWEFGFGDHETRGPISAVWTCPQGQSGGDQLVSRIEIEKTGTSSQGRVYTAYLSRSSLRLSDETLRTGFRFNIAVNDHDGVMRAHALQLAPGIVINKSMGNTPFVIFK